MKKVKMILTNRFDPDVRVFKEAKYLVAKGFDVEILCWDRENEYRDRKTEDVEGITIRRFFPYAKYGTGYKQLVSFFRYIKECREYLKDEEYEYLHCHDLDGIIVGYLINKNNSKLIFDMHEFYEVQGTKQKIRYLVRAIVSYMQTKSDYIVYVNAIQKHVVREKNIEKLVFLPNYPVIDDYPGCEKTKTSELRISYIGAVRQYNELKNLMDACHSIENVKVSIHGAGVAYKKLNDIKMNYKNVEVTGVYHFKNSSKLYKETDILYAMYPMNTVQNKKLFPVKFFEAIITRTPIIVSRGSVLEDFLKKNDIGFVVDGANIAEIRKLIKTINENKSVLDQKIANLEKIRNNYSWSEVVNNLDSIFK